MNLKIPPTLSSCLLHSNVVLRLNFNIPSKVKDRLQEFILINYHFNFRYFIHFFFVIFFKNLKAKKQIVILFVLKSKYINVNLI